VLAARKELGDEYDRAFVEGLLERVSSEIDERVDARLAEVGGRTRPRHRRGSPSMVFYSLVLGIPISAIAGSDAHLAGLAVAWGGIAVVNIAHAWRPGEDRAPRRRS